MSTVLDVMLQPPYYQGMDKNKTIEHFGSQSEVARVLGISRQAVSSWPEVIPEVCALRLHLHTGGDLPYDPAPYREVGT